MPTVNLQQLTGYDQFGSDWDSNIGTEGYWNPESEQGRTNWSNWMGSASEQDWTDLSGQLGVDPAELQTQFGSAFAPGITAPQVYKPDLYPTAYKGLGNDYIQQIMGSVVPRLQTSIEDYDTNIDQYTGEAAAMGRGNAKNLLDDVLQSSLNTMSSRNMIGRVGGMDRLAQVASLGEYSLSEDPSVPQQILANTIQGIS